MAQEKELVHGMAVCHASANLSRLASAVFILDEKGIIRYRHVEATPLSHRKSEELIELIQNLKKQNTL